MKLNAIQLQVGHDVDYIFVLKENPLTYSNPANPFADLINIDTLSGTSTSVTAGGTRYLPLDFVKGILVLVMVVYHIMNYFSTAEDHGFSFVRFVTGAFIFISGYNISVLYSEKFRINKIAVSKRIFTKGFKLMVLFTVLNILIVLTGVGNPTKRQYGIESYISNYFDIYILGNPRAAAFQILLPIAYLLIVSPAILIFIRFKYYVAAIILFLVMYLSFFAENSVNLSLGMVGLLGLASGLVTGKMGLKSPGMNRIMVICCIVICIYLNKFLYENLITYSIGIAILLKLFHDLGSSMSDDNKLNRSIILFGQYSLFAYISQIVFLQSLFRILPYQRWGIGYEIIIIFVVTCFFLWIFCIMIKYFRGRFRLVDICYKLVFS